ncbi:MAG TPA: PHP domain-containing protein, partial [Candidatus Limnocylindrales bacterium]|nr:PHP domain-containing protein [Candidatus Limnocylindrales bacterium]
MASDADPGTRAPSATARVDLHCHTSASFDSLVDPAAVIARAVTRGLTHIAITDHDVIDGALEAVAAAPPGIHVLVGCESHTVEGDLVFVFPERPIPKGLAAREAIIAAWEQGALVGVPHPYDPARRSLLLDPANQPLLALVDWIEGWNGRVGRQADNDHASAAARRRHLPAVAVSDAHTLLEIGTMFTTMTGDPSSPAGLLAA